MRILLVALFFIIAIFPDCIESNRQQLFLQLQQLKTATCFSKGVYFYALSKKITGKMNFEYLVQNGNHAVIDGFIVGAIKDRELRPIFDKNHFGILVRESDWNNVQLLPEVAQNIPYFEEWDPSFGSGGAGSSAQEPNMLGAANSPHISPTGWNH